jgi:hypothetical protein
MDVQQTSLVPQILAWVNGLTLPGVLAAAAGAARWYTKREDAAKAVVSDALKQLETIRTNDLHHIQGTLDEIKSGQEKGFEAAERHKSEIVAATVTSQTAIVQAILTLKS